MLEIRNATWVKNAHTTVPNFSMAAPDSTLTAICGRKGCGKTALIETLMGLRPLAKGYVSVDGELLRPATAVFFRSRMAYVPQTLQAPGQLTANELLQLYADCSKRSHQTLRKDDVQQLWPALQLDDALWTASLYRLSASEQRRIMLSFALGAHRSILVADDPTGGLDDALSHVVTRLLSQYAALGHTVLVATSDPVLVGVAHHLVSLT